MTGATGSPEQLVNEPTLALRRSLAYPDLILVFPLLLALSNDTWCYRHRALEVYYYYNLNAEIGCSD